MFCFINIVFLVVVKIFIYVFYVMGCYVMMDIFLKIDSKVYISMDFK